MYISRNEKTNLIEFSICKYLTLANEFGTNTNFQTDFFELLNQNSFVYQFSSYFSAL